MTSLQPLILLFWCPYFCEGDFRSAVCSRDSHFLFCPSGAIPNDVPVIAGRNVTTSAKLLPVNGSLSAINKFCSQYKADYANCAGPSPPPDFAKKFCVFYHDTCPGAAPLAAAKIEDIPVVNVSASTLPPGGSWVNPFLARSGGIVNNPQLIGVDTRGGNLLPSNVPSGGQQQPPPPKVPAAAEAPSIATSGSSAVSPPQANAANSIVGSTSNTQAGPVNVGSSSNVGLGGLTNLISGGTGG